jgi:hypothetical protein
MTCALPASAEWVSFAYPGPTFAGLALKRDGANRLAARPFLPASLPGAD